MARTEQQTAALKETLYQELEQQLDLSIHGIGVDADEIGKLDSHYAHRLSNISYAAPLSYKFVGGKMQTPGFDTGFRQQANSIYGLEAEDGKPVIFKYGKKKTRIGEIEFHEQSYHPLLDSITRDGVPFHTIASLRPDGQVHVNYSQECVLKEKGEDCLFCNYSVREATLKTPQQVGEVFSTLYEAGVGRHLNLTSGFLHERKELDYYLDVADEIQSRTGLKEFRATAVVGAPLDFSVIDKYKEAGYFSIRMNMEIWDKDIWGAICPGKRKYCGGWDNWVKALEYAAKVFGKGRVASNIVGGIEPKKSILEGVEYKASKGIVGSASTWRAVVGSVLEGHRSPETAWHFDLQRQIAGIYKRYGFSFSDLHNVTPTAGLAVTIFQIEQEAFDCNGLLTPWQYPSPE
jgi:hypothetical protein